jgi:hypothetical protein
MIDEISDTGANHISLVVSWCLNDIRSVKIQPCAKEPKPGQGVIPSPERVNEVIRYATQKGLKVVLFPILQLVQREKGEWRGTLAPSNLDDFWKSYTQFVLHFAKIGQAHGAVVYSVGSELASLEKYRNRWVKLIKKVRTQFAGKLMYSANWDHYEPVTFWDHIELPGLTGYYELSASKKPTIQEIKTAWKPIQKKIVKWSKKIGKPFLFTEIGYPALVGAAHYPWDYTMKTEVSLEEQYRATRAFYEAWQHVAQFQGFFYWNWFGIGGKNSGYYTPRNKPSELVLRAWYLGVSELGQAR